MSGLASELNTRRRHPVHSSAFRETCSHVFWSNAEPWEHRHFPEGSLVFCKIDEVWRLFRALRRTRRRVIVVTGEGDKPVSPALWRQRPTQAAHWFGMNMFVSHPCATGLPLGLGEPGASATLDWDDIEKALKNPHPRHGLLYGNFGTASNPEVRQRLRQWIAMPEQGWITREDHGGPTGKERYLAQLLSHQFVLCPPGNGEDTHRMWEALYCGAIPVVRDSPVIRKFPGLPMVVVEDFRQLTPKFLAERKAQLDQEQPKLDYLWMDYWQKEFTRRKEEMDARPLVSWKEWAASWLKEVFRVAIGR